MGKKTQSESDQGRKNLIAATLISVPGPLLLAIHLPGGAGVTQIADLIRRSFEFLAVFFTWLTYEITARGILTDDTGRIGDPCADVAGTYMITKLLAADSGGHNAFERFLFNIFTPLFADIYLKEYLKLSGRSRGDIFRWIPIRAVTYMDLGLPEQVNEKLYEIAKKV